MRTTGNVRNTFTAGFAASTMRRTSVPIEEEVEAENDNAEKIKSSLKVSLTDKLRGGVRTTMNSNHDEIPQ